MWSQQAGGQYQLRSAAPCNFPKDTDGDNRSTAIGCWNPERAAVAIHVAHVLGSRTASTTSRIAAITRFG